MLDVIKQKKLNVRYIIRNTCHTTFVVRVWCYEYCTSMAQVYTRREKEISRRCISNTKRRVALQATALLHVPVRSRAVNPRQNNDISSALAFTYTSHDVTLLLSLKH